MGALFNFSNPLGMRAVPNLSSRQNNTRHSCRIMRHAQNSFRPRSSSWIHTIIHVHAECSTDDQVQGIPNTHEIPRLHVG
jgi:hypothetical protein